MMDLMGSLASDPVGGAPAAVTAAVPMVGTGAAMTSSTSAAPAPVGAMGAMGAVTVTAFQKDGLTVTFACTKPDPVNNPAATTVTASYVNAGPAPVTGFTLQAAVPKTMTLALQPASGADVPPNGGAVTQVLNVVNSQQGVKPIAMRLRMTWTDGAGVAPGTGPVTEQATVNFPPGL